MSKKTFPKFENLENKFRFTSKNKINIANPILPESLEREY